jgi:predicted Zn-ribbon and HTH transcriptional regulator
MSREQWLLDAIKLIENEVFKPVGENVTEMRVSVGLPSKRALSSKNRRIGECWSGNASADGVPTVFISPLEEDAVGVLAILAHEMIHAKGINGHGKDFKLVAMKIGLDGPMTATHADTKLTAQLEKVKEKLGDYPHVALDPSNRKKQTTRLIKCMCRDCGYIVRTTDKWLDRSGPPICPEDHIPMDEC